MPYTVNYSFDIFCSQFVDLDAKDVKKARASRDYLKDQIAAIAENDIAFPRTTGNYLGFGSFARKTKAMILNDIDILLILHGTGTQEMYRGNNTSWLYCNDQSLPIWVYTDEHNFVNSTSVLNKLKRSLFTIPNYSSADIKRTEMAVVLNLKSYTWVFDIVPAIPISDGANGVEYYLIPNGKGEWMRTDPRRDQRAITAVNQQHNEKLIPIMRIMKYWNERYYNTPRLQSYYLETMLINGFRNYSAISSIKSGLPIAFDILALHILLPCPDPKGLGSNLDEGISWDTISKIQQEAKKMADYARLALHYEQQDDHKTAIKYWGYIFHDFPPYGEL